MALLLGTDIDRLVNTKIEGRVARVGGTVNQLLTYDRLKIREVIDINLVDDFFGTTSLSNAKDAGKLVRGVISRFKQELLRIAKGVRVPLDRKTLVLDVHEAYKCPELKGLYDCTISSNLIEHSPNPIFLLLNIHFMSRRGGYQFHAIPHYKYTYDVYRTPTPLEHLIEDFEKKTDITDKTHHEEYIRSAIEQHGWMKKFHQTYPIAPPYIHFHVFDEHNTRSLMELMFQDVVSDVLKNENFSDNVVLFRNELNPDFVARFKWLIDEYSSAFLGGS